MVLYHLYINSDAGREVGVREGLNKLVYARIVRMDVDPEKFAEAKKKALARYESQKSIRCPYFQTDVILNSDGFHHLQFSARRERNKREQMLKFSFLPLGLEIIKRSGTIQEYRKILMPVGKKSIRDGFTPMKEVEFWGLVAIVGSEKPRKVRVVLRKVGTGNITFWSVMPYGKIENGSQRLTGQGLEDE